ncbi:LINE-1 retrotransposable element ORF1 protein [Scomber scombrus]|uniref:LINE-1 retrotransposable element ORF1 protein n=1 Tax=Scomber scombrus TaxID=13677 RepID=A0AAV1P7I2_SCOSC
MANVEDSLTLTSLVQELDKHRASLTAELKKNLSASLDTSLMPIQTLLETISAVLDSHSQKITTIEGTLTAHSDELAELTTRVGQLEKANAALTSKTEDLENRCRRQNLRIVSLPEGLEGGSPVEFISRLLQTVIENDVFPEPPELDRAHRTLAPKPAAG